uniref:Uncharacterized protein n=1 Tax=Labrus bergylta TaxID=56723 RepID=A0A3Q3EPI3_9LABR
MSPKNFKLTFEALNEEQTFTSGDTIRGTLTFTLTEDTKVKSLGVKVKGYAHVHWTEGTGDRRISTYHWGKGQFKYILLYHTMLLLVNNLLVLFFSDLPSSFKDLHGKVVYSLIARMSRSFRLKAIVITKLLCKSHRQFQHISIIISMTLPKQGRIHPKFNICNSSSKKMKPKFSLIQKIVYRAHVSTEHSYRTHCKVVGETIASNSNETVSCKLTVPVGAVYTMNNCELITNEYYVQVMINVIKVLHQLTNEPLLLAGVCVIVAQIYNIQSYTTHATNIFKHIREHNSIIGA